MVPRLVRVAPEGDDWLHEVKFDGWRGQLHISRGSMRPFSRGGHDLSRRFRRLVDSLEGSFKGSAVIDGELVAYDATGMENFATLMREGAKAPALRFWAFDLMAENGRAVTQLPLVVRKGRLEEVVGGIGQAQVQLSGVFDDPRALLAAAEKMRLEGIVSKRRDSVYRAGARGDWLKVKTQAWRAAQASRGTLFGRRSGA